MRHIGFPQPMFVLSVRRLAGRLSQQWEWERKLHVLVLLVVQMCRITERIRSTWCSGDRKKSQLHCDPKTKVIKTNFLKGEIEEATVRLPIYSTGIKYCVVLAIAACFLVAVFVFADAPTWLLFALFALALYGATRFFRADGESEEPRPWWQVFDRGAGGSQPNNLSDSFNGDKPLMGQKGAGHRGYRHLPRFRGIFFLQLQKAQGARKDRAKTLQSLARYARGAPLLP